MNSLFISWLSIISQQHSQLHSSSDWKSDLLSLKKSDIFLTSTFLVQLFFDVFSTLFYHVFPIFFATSEKKIFFFHHFFFPPPTTPIMFYLPECQFYISPHFWISKFPDLNNSLPPPSLVALPSTTICLLLHQLTVHFAIDYWMFTQNSQLIWQQLTHWLLKLQVVFLIILQPASTAASTTDNAIHAATISTTAIDHSFFNQLTQWVTNWAFTFHVQSPNLQLPFPTSCSILPTAIELPQLANTIRVATISTTTIDYWFFSQQTQPALTTANTTR